MAKKRQKTINAKKPRKTIKNETLGTLKLSAMLPDGIEYSVKKKLGGSSVQLVLYSAENSQDMEAAIALASKLVKEFKKVQSRLNKYLTQTVLKKINANLRRNDPLNPAEFLEQLKLKIIDLHANGKASFWYSDVEVLSGHELVLFGKADGTIDDFDTPG